jgi:hypothetical protein
MNPKSLIPAVLVVVLILAGLLAFKAFSSGSDQSKGNSKPTPTPEEIVEQLTLDKQPKVAMTFSADGHYVTVKISNINAAELEYNLIYDATVKKNQIQTGVTGSAKLTGSTEYTNKQLLGSESSGKFTYHENIKNAVMELTLRNSSGYSIFSGSYPFVVSSGKTIDVVASD